MQVPQAAQLLVDRSEGAFVYIARILDQLESSGGSKWTLDAIQVVLRMRCLKSLHVYSLFSLPCCRVTVARIVHMVIT